MQPSSMRWLAAVAVANVACTLAVPGMVRAGTWLERGPNVSGRFSAIVIDPADSRRLLAASPGGGIWRSVDHGRTWTHPASLGLGDLTVVHLEWDKRVSGRLYASTASDLYATTDFGDSFTNLTHHGGVPAPPLPVRHMEDPAPFAQLSYAGGAAVFWARSCSGLEYSFDGVSFTAHVPFPGGSTNLDNCIQSIAADRDTGRVYFTTMARLDSPRLYRSTCAWNRGAACTTWEAAGNGLPFGDYVHSIAWDGAADRLVAVSYLGSTRLHRTTNGRDWSPFPTQPPASSWAQRPLVALGGDRYVVGTVVAYATSDGGRSWRELVFPGMHPDVRTIARGLDDVEYLLLGADGSDGEGTAVNLSLWPLPRTGLPGPGSAVGTEGMRTWQTYVVAVTGENVLRLHRRLFAGSQDNSALCSDDGGLTWTARGAPLSAGCGDFPSIVVAPSDRNRVYARTCASTGFARSDNAATALRCEDVEWRVIEPMVGHYATNLWTSRMTAVDPRNPDRVVFARNWEVGISTDGGEMWALRTLPGRAEPVSVLIDRGGAIYVGTIDHGIYRSADGGDSWLPFGLNDPAPLAVMAVEHSSAGGAEGTFFAATTGGLYRKLPGGTFTRVTTGGYAASDVAIDPRCPKRLYVGLGYAADRMRHRGGVLWSQDNGSTFASLSVGRDVHATPIADVVVDPLDSRYLQVATYGRGVWTYDHGAAPSCPPG